MIYNITIYKIYGFSVLGVRFLPAHEKEIQHEFHIETQY
jgi:hypothetical protein